MKDDKNKEDNRYHNHKDEFHIFDEVRLREEKLKDEKNNKKNKINNLKVYPFFLVLCTTATITFVAVKTHEAVQPINIVTFDIMANEGYALSDNGREFDPKMFGKNDKEKLYEYVRNNKITPEELEQSIYKFLKKERFTKDEEKLKNIVEGIKKDFPRAFGIVNIDLDFNNNIVIEVVKEGNSK